MSDPWAEFRAPSGVSVGPNGVPRVVIDTGNIGKPDDPWAAFRAAPSVAERSDVSQGIPQNAEALSKGLRANADNRVIEDVGLPNSPIVAGATSFANTLGMNIPRNVAAGLETLTNDKSFSQNYDRYKAAEEALGRQNPISATAGTALGIAGGAVLLPGIGGGATMLGRAGRAAGTGAIYGGVGELLDSKDPINAAVATGLGAGLGFVAAPVAEKIVGIVSKYVRTGKTDIKFLNADGSLTDEAAAAARSAGVDPSEFQQVLTNAYAKKFTERGATPATARDAAADEFGIRLSPGQSTGDFTRSKYEQDAARGGYGPFATKAARNFFDEQNAQVGAAKGAFNERFAGDSPVAGSVDDAASTVGQGVRNAANEAKATFKGQYKDAFNEPGQFNDIAFRNVGDRIKANLSNGEAPIIIDDVTTPIAARALKDLDNISSLRVQNLADPNGAPKTRSEDGNLSQAAKDVIAMFNGDAKKAADYLRDSVATGKAGSAADAFRAAASEIDNYGAQAVASINLKGVEQSRKRLVAFYNAAKSNPNAAADRRAIQGIIKSFDDEIEQSMATGLFSGSDKAIEKLKEARASYAKYRQTFGPQGAGDDAGRAIQKIVDRDATAGEIANMLYGKSAIGEKGSSVRTAQRVKKIFGEGSEEWSAVKQGLWQRLTSKPEGVDDFGPQALSQRIHKFLGGDGADLARAVFTPEEIGQMRRFAVAVKNVVPPKDSVNHSGTAYTMAALQASGLGGSALYFGADPGTAGSLAALRVGGKLARDVIKGRSASKYFANGTPSTLRPAGADITPNAGVASGLAAGQSF